LMNTDLSFVIVGEGTRSIRIVRSTIVDAGVRAGAAVGAAVARRM